jgi:hypothetical protein
VPIGSPTAAWDSQQLNPRIRPAKQSVAMMANAGSKSLNWVLLVAMAVALFMGCAKRNDAVRRANTKDAPQRVPAPKVAETKAIAE